MDELPRLSRTHRKAAIQVAFGACKVADFGVAMARRGYFGAARAAKLLFKSPFGGQTPESAFCLCGGPIFLCPKGLRGLLWAPGADFFVKFEVPQRQQLASETRTPEGCSAHRISIRYTRSLFFTPSASENAFGTPGSLF